MEFDNRPHIIAAFDFDGTITMKDSLFDFLFFYFGKTKAIIGLFILSPLLILYKIGIIKNYVAKEILFSFFFKNKSISDFNKICTKYEKRIKNICISSTLDRIKWHQQQNHTVLIISASIANWIKPWAKEMGIDKVIGTEIEVKDNLITGKFKSLNCYGQEKVNRLLALYPNKNNYVLYAYGDSKGDKELLEISDYKYFIKNKK